MTWITKKDLEAVLRDRGYGRYRIIEMRGEIRIEVAPSDFYDALCTVGLGAAAGVRVNLVGLAWWRCRFRRKQWIREL